MVKEDDYNDISMDIDDFGIVEPPYILGNMCAEEPPNILEVKCAPKPDHYNVIYDSGSTTDPYAEETLIDEDKGDHCVIVSKLCFKKKLDPEPGYKTIAQSRYSDFLDDTIEKKSKNKNET